MRGRSDLIQFLLIGLCSNYVQRTNNGSSEAFNCILKSEKEVEKDVLRGKTLKLLTFDNMPMSGTRTPEGETALKGVGIAFEVINALQKKFGFEYKLERQIPPVVGDKLSGALERLVTGVWILILVSLVSVGPIMYSIMWLRKKLCPNEHPQVYSLSACVWFVYGALMKQGSTLDPISDSARMMFATWWIFILILTAFYTANLTAFLTLSLATLPINEIEDVAKPPNKWFAEDGGAVYYAVKEKDGDLNILYNSINNGRGMFVDTSKRGTADMKISDGWLYLDDWYTLTRLMFDDYKLKRKMAANTGIESCTYVLTEKHFLERAFAFAYQQDSSLPLLFDPVVLRFIESGIFKHLFNLDLPDTVVCPLNLGNKDRRLRNSDLFTTYMVVLTGFVAGLTVFVGEILWRLSHNYQTVEYPPDLIQMQQNSYNNKFNSHQYFNVDKKLIPLRTPSAMIVHYG